ncbi:hypothetical protein L1887_18968 [Cichorium endivia]|nr:hypothetical protein L1887_18968 [Cichorium endivia]
METLKVLEKQEEEVESNYSELHTRLKLEVSELEKMIQSNDHEGSFAQNVNNSSTNSIQKLNSAKMIREGSLQGVGQCLIREYRMVCDVKRGQVSNDFFAIPIWDFICSMITSTF